MKDHLTELYYRDTRQLTIVAPVPGTWPRMIPSFTLNIKLILCGKFTTGICAPGGVCLHIWVSYLI